MYGYEKIDHAEDVVVCMKNLFEDARREKSIVKVSRCGHRTLARRRKGRRGSKEASLASVWYVILPHVRAVLYQLNAVGRHANRKM
jgi:hypothetical protein